MIMDNACVCSRMEEGADMHSLLMTDNNSLLMGGLQNYVVEVDLNAVQETQKVRHWDEVSTSTAGWFTFMSCVFNSSRLRYPGWR